MANRESQSSWRTFLLGSRERGLSGAELVVADDHAGLRAAIREVLSEAAYQRCYVHFLRHALDHLPRKADDDCLQELRWLYDRRSVEEARRDLAAWIAKWEGRYPRLVAWAEETIEETHLRGADLPQCRLMLPAGAGSGGRDARELAGSPPLPQHGGSQGAQEKHSSRSRLASLTGRPALQNLTHTILLRSCRSP
jgi:hypothetical protein